LPLDFIFLSLGPGSILVIVQQIFLLLLGCGRGSSVFKKKEIYKKILCVSASTSLLSFKQHAWLIPAAKKIIPGWRQLHFSVSCIGYVARAPRILSFGIDICFFFFFLSFFFLVFALCLSIFQVSP